MEEFEPSSHDWNRDWRSSSQVPTLGFGSGVPTKFQSLESGMDEFEPKLGRLESGLEEFGPKLRRLESGL